MYVDVKMSSKGEIVIPAFIRRQFKFQEGGSVRLAVEQNSIRLVTQKKDVVAWMRAYAKEYGKPTDKIISGDQLYEEEFG
ncbi:MAG: AbrB/MazE/SpoVT family DNA-binding domain-containing protein [Candidatus Micrarchaeota archaeon]